MGKCSRCGKKKLFLKLSVNGLCPECEIQYQKEELQKGIKKQKEEWIPPILEVSGKTYYRGRYYTDCKIKTGVLLKDRICKDMPIKFKQEIEDGVRYLSVYTLNDAYVGLVQSRNIKDMLENFDYEHKPYRANLKNVSDSNTTFTIWTYFDKLTSLPSLSPFPLESTQDEYNCYLQIPETKNKIINLKRNEVYYENKLIGRISDEAEAEIENLKKDCYVVCVFFGTRKSKEKPIITIKAYYQDLTMPEEIFRERIIIPTT